MQMGKYPELTRGFMAQAIAMKEANKYWHDLVALFKNEVARNLESHFANGLAVAIGRSYKEPELQQLISLCENPIYGFNRIWFADGLRKSKSTSAESALTRVSNDPQIGKQVTRWMRKRGAAKIE